MYRLVFLSLAFFALAKSQKTSDMYSIPEDCADNCTYKVMWQSVPGGMVEFTVSAMVPRGVWAGVGFSPSGGMIGSDAVVGWMSASGGDEFILTDRFLLGKSPSQVPVDSDEEDVVLMSFSHNNEELKYMFRRPIVPQDTQRDLSLADGIPIIYAWGGKGYDNKSITIHAAQGNIGRTVNFVNLPAVSSARPPPNMMVETPMPPMEEIPGPPSSGARSLGRQNQGPSSAGARSLGRQNQVADSCMRNSCPPNSECTMERGVARCYCKPGYPMDRHGNCVAAAGMQPSMPDDQNRAAGGMQPSMPDSQNRAGAGMQPPMPDGQNRAGAGMQPPMPDGQNRAAGGMQPSMPDGQNRAGPGMQPPMPDGQNRGQNRPIMVNRCNGVICDAKYTTCRDGKCVCMPGYKGQSDGNCRKAFSIGSICGGRNCHQNSECKLGKCHCKTGYVSHNGVCASVSSTGTMCSGMRCYTNAECKMGKCYCKIGYTRRSSSCVKFSAHRGCTTMNCGQGTCVIRDGRASCAFTSTRPHSASSTASCHGRCGTYLTKHGCSCSHHCLRYGRCCPDFRNRCGHLLPFFHPHRG